MANGTNTITTKFASALLAAQQQITEVEKGADNPYFKSKYADLSSVIDAVKPALNKNGIVFLQFPATAPFENYLALTTVLIYAPTGEMLQETANTPLAKSDPQGFGSAVTYLRRYGLQSIVGLKAVDDDGNAASEPGLQQPRAAFKQAKPQATAPVKSKAGLFPVPKRG
jgi:hypothetical protein